MEQFTIALKINSFQSTADNKGFLLMELNKYNEAIDYYNEIIKIDPKKGGVYNGLGIALSEIKNLMTRLMRLINQFIWNLYLYLLMQIWRLLL